MNSKFDYDLLSAMMTNANMGWWEADLKTESYICSEYISQLLGLDEDGTISFKDFNKRILKEEQRHTTAHSFDDIRQTQEAVDSTMGVGSTFTVELPCRTRPFLTTNEKQ